MAGLLICSVLAGLYFITRTSSSSDSSQPPVAQSNEEPNSDGGSSPILKTPKTKTVDAAMLENGEQEKTKSSANEKNIEKKETINKSAILNETTETANLEPSVAEIPPPPPLKKQPRNQTRQPVTSEQPAPDIESIFTGGASEQPDKVQPRRDERKQERDDWSEEELREMRRQRKQERRQQRQNDNTIPF
jgi:hypothetical protein